MSATGIARKVPRWCDWLIRTFAADEPLRHGDAASAWAWEKLIRENEDLRRESYDYAGVVKELEADVLLWEQLRERTADADPMHALLGLRIAAIRSTIVSAEVVRADIHRGAVEAFRDLLDEAKDMRAYVPEQFAKKWKHDEALERAQAWLDANGGQ
jgi:hypothetical protein